MTRLRFERLAKNLTQSSLATAVGCDQSDLCAWELGRAMPSPVALARLAEVLGVDAAVLLLEVEIFKPELRPRDPVSGRYIRGPR